ncbi:MAG: hypothetical protein ACE5FU_01760, partial [Nitrospinota bacterium]
IKPGSSFKEGYEAGYKAGLTKKSQKKKDRKRHSKPKIWFADMIMRIGEKEEKILPLVKKKYKVEKSKNDWLVKSRETNNTFGVIRFVNGKLASVGRLWASLQDPEAVNLGSALFNALSGLTKIENENLSMTTKTTAKKEYTQKLIVFKTLNRNIRVSILVGRRINKIEVQEVLF